MYSGTEPVGPRGISSSLRRSPKSAQFGHQNGGGGVDTELVTEMSTLWPSKPCAGCLWSVSAARIVRCEI